MYCYKCGKKIEENLNFCPFCGCNLEDDEKEKIKEVDKKEKEVAKEKSNEKKDEKKLENKKVKNEEKNKHENNNKEKKHFPKWIIFLIIGVLLLLVIILILNFLVIKKRYYENGSFKNVDGIDTYYEDDNIVKDSLVYYKGKKYYVDEEGHKKKNAWGIIDNDGNYGYFGSLGELVVNNLKEIDKKYYYFDENGVMASDKFVEFNDATYYASNDGALLHMQFKILDKDYYFGRNGKLVVEEGWVRNRGDESKRGLERGMYYLDEKGQRIKEKWLGDVYVDKNGKKAVNTWVGEYYVDDKGVYMHDCYTPDGIKLGSDGKAVAGQNLQNRNVIETTKAITQYTTAAIYETTTVRVTEPQTYASPIVATEKVNTPISPAEEIKEKETTSQSNVYNGGGISTDELIKQGMILDAKNEETSASRSKVYNVEQNGPVAEYQVVKGVREGQNVEDDDWDEDWYDDDDDYDEDDDEVESEIKITSTEKIEEDYSDEEYDCSIVLLKPIVRGGASYEADTINDCMEEMMDELMDEVDTIMNTYSSLPKSIIFSSATITSSSSSRVVITLSGKVTPRSGSAKTIKYKITYDRNDEMATLSKG